MLNIKEFMLGILYPRRCPICGEIVMEKDSTICDPCRKYACPIQEPRCKKCSKELDSDEKEYCYDCMRTPHFYTRGIAVFPYDNYLKKSIYQMKFHNKREYNDFYVDEMLRSSGMVLSEWKPDVIVPVPLHKSKQRQRGFNQSELLARGIGKKLGIPVSSNLVLRVRATMPQKELSKKNRKINLKNAFKINKYDVKLKRILLIDDIYTTGTTIDTIACELLKQGAEQVYFAVVCIGREDS